MQCTIALPPHGRLTNGNEILGGPIPADRQLQPGQYGVIISPRIASCLVNSHLQVHSASSFRIARCRPRSVTFWSGHSPFASCWGRCSASHAASSAQLAATPCLC